MKIMVIQGPNINMLGVRETGLYGLMKMQDIHEQMKLAASQQQGVELEFFQSNFEGELVDKVQECLVQKMVSSSTPQATRTLLWLCAMRLRLWVCQR